MKMYPLYRFLILFVSDHSQNCNHSPTRFFIIRMWCNIFIIYPNTDVHDRSLYWLDFPIFRFWAYLKKVMSETRRAY